MSDDSGSVTSPPAKSRRLGLWAVALLCLFVLLTVGAYFYQIFSAEYELRAAFAEVERTDPRWRLADIEADRASVPVDGNSASVVTKAKQLLPSDWPFWNPPHPVVTRPGRPPDPEAEARERAFADRLENLEPQRLLDKEQMAALEAELARAADALAAARPLDHLTEGRYAVAYSPDWMTTKTPHFNDVRQVSRLLAWDAALRAQNGDADGALASCRQALNAGRSIGDEPMLLSQVVRLFCDITAVTHMERVFAQGEPSGDALATTQQLLQMEERATPIQIALRGERAGDDSLMEAIASGRSSMTARDLAKLSHPLANSLTLEQELKLWQPGFLNSRRAALLRCMNEAVELSVPPSERRHDAFARWDAAAPGRLGAVRVLLPALGKFADACTRSEALLRSAVVATAAERYRRAKGGWPESLEALATAGYLTETPADPFDGKPLRWRRLDDGAAAYSVGPDGVDDGGKINRKNWTEPGTDIGFRLWDVSRRRQPPDAGSQGK